MKKFKTGLCSVSFKRIEAEDVLTAMKNAGLKYVEWSAKGHAPWNDAEKIDELVLLQKKHGITCSSYGTYFYFMHNSLDELISCINVAKKLGCRVLRVWAGRKSSADYTAEEKQAFFEECRKAVSIAQKENVMLCMEFHQNSFTDTVESSLELMKAVNSEHLRMYWQPNSTENAIKRLEIARTLSPYTVNIHVFHSENSVQYPLSTGKELWKRYLCEFSGNNTLLLEFMPDGKLESLADEAKALNDIVNNII